MIVKCISTSRSHEEGDSDPWLKAGREYVVLSIYENAQREKYYRLAAHDDGGFGSLGLFPSAAFDVVDSAWPHTWVEEIINGDISIAPKAWNRPGFWEEFYDGDRQAENTYRDEREKILKNES